MWCIPWYQWWLKIGMVASSWQQLLILDASNTLRWPWWSTHNLSKFLSGRVPTDDPRREFIWCWLSQVVFVNFAAKHVPPSPASPVKLAALCCMKTSSGTHLGTLQSCLETNPHPTPSQEGTVPPWHTHLLLVPKSHVFRGTVKLAVTECMSCRFCRDSRSIWEEYHIRRLHYSYILLWLWWWNLKSACDIHQYAYMIDFQVQ